MPTSRRRRTVSAAQALTAAAEAVQDEVGALVTPLERAQVTTALLQDVAGLQRSVAMLRLEAVAELREAQWSYRAIGQALGLSPNAIVQIDKQRRRA